MSNYSPSDLTHCFCLGLPCLFSKLQLPILVTAPDNWSLLILLLSTRFLGRDQHLRMSRTLHRPAPDPVLHPTDGRYGQEGWYPRRDPTKRLRRWMRSGYPIVRVLLVVLWWPCTWAGLTKEGECGLPSLALRCLDSNSRLVLHCGFGWCNKDTISLDCVALVHPTLLTFIEY